MEILQNNVYLDTCAPTFNFCNIPEALVLILVSFYIYIYLIVSLFLHFFLCYSFVVCCIYAAMITQFPSGINEVSLILILKTTVVQVPGDIVYNAGL